ncbi:MAG: SGNH/GDSL hydrolase family protein [Planctomycetota bacterium]
MGENGGHGAHRDRHAAELAREVDETPARTAFRPVEAGRVLVFFLLLPILLHVVGIVVSGARGDGFRFRAIDAVLLVIVLLYGGVVLLVRRRRDAAAKMLLVVYSTLFALLGVEFVLALRGNQPFPWPPLQRVAIAADTMPGIEGEIRFTINSMGVRAPPVWPEERLDRVLCVGGSTTECLYVTDESSWPWRLGTRLGERLGRPILVASAGRSGHITRHHEYQLRHYPYASEYGTVLILCGMNDAGALLRGNYEKRVRRVPNEALGKAVKEVPYYRNTAIARNLRDLLHGASGGLEQVAQDEAGHWYAELRERRRKLLASGPITTLPEGLPASLETYRRNLVALHELCNERGQTLVFMTQPVLHHEGMPDELAALLMQHTDHGAHAPGIVDQVIEAFNDVLRAVCRERGIVLVDLAAQLPKDTTVFYDDCHFNVSGCAAVVQALLDPMVAVLCRPAAPSR